MFTFDLKNCDPSMIHVAALVYGRFYLSIICRELYACTYSMYQALVFSPLLKRTSVKGIYNNKPIHVMIEL